MKFQDIIGQEEIVRSLKKKAEGGDFGHAYIFSGPEGIGKRTVSKVFAEAITCMDENSDLSGKPCGSCRACKLAEEGINPDIIYIDQGKDNSIGIEIIRKMQEDISIRPLYGNKKIYIISNGENMTLQAQNCLLKTFEEPPACVVIIITTSNYGMLLETIRSRAVRYEFKRNSHEEVRKALKLNAKNVKDADMDLIISFSQGIIGKALEMANSEDFFELREKSIEIANSILENNDVNILKNIAFFEKNKDDFNRILDYMQVWYRDICVASGHGRENILINSDKKDIIFKNAVGTSADKIQRILRNLEYTRKALKQNVNFQLAVEYMLFKIQEDIK